MSNFTVTKTTTTLIKCYACKGSGNQKHTFRKRTYVANCPVCKGKGSVPYSRKEEVSLEEALREINYQS